jgi:putative aldouronate transport system substrate-binding protein
MTRSERRGFRAIAVVIALLIAASQAAGIASASQATAVAGPQRLDETVTIRLMTNVNSPEVGPPGDDWFLKQAILDELNIDVQFEFVTQTSEYDSKLQTLAAANDLPDLFTINPSSIPLLNSQGLLGDWSPYLGSMPTYGQYRDIENLKQIGTYDGKQVALVTKNVAPFKTVFVVRQDWLDKLGLAAPTTTDELMAVMQAFTEQDPDGNGQADTYGYSGFVNSRGEIGGFESIFGAFGALGTWSITDNALSLVGASEQRKNALDYISQMNANGVMDPDWTSQPFEDFRTKWKAGKVGVFVEDWCATFCVQGYGEFVQANPTGVLTPIEPPAGPNGDAAVNTFSLVGTQYGMSTKAADEGKGEAIARLLEWFATTGYERTAFGDPATDFTKDANGLITQKLELEVLPRRQLCAWAYRGTPDEWRTRYGFVTDYPNGQTIDVYAILEQAQERPKVDITAHAALPPMPAEVAADLQRTIAEGEFAFASGSQPIDGWDAYVETLNSIGMQTWIDAATERGKEVGLITG